MTLKLSSYLLLKFSSVPFTIVLISHISSTMVNGTLLNFVKRYEDDLRVIFDQWPKFHLGLDALSNQKILNGIYYVMQMLLQHQFRNVETSQSLSHEIRYLLCCYVVSAFALFINTYFVFISQ